MRVGDPLVVTAIAVVVALVVLFAILHFGFRVFRRRKGKSRVKSAVTNDSRVQVLETTIIDAERKLVLIRCDKIEHLIMIGGPADLVVENDVRKVRGPGAPPAKVPGIEPEKRPALPQRVAQPAAAAHEPAITPAPKAPEPIRPAPRPIGDVRQPMAAARSIPPIPTTTSGRPGAKNGADSTALVPAAPRPQSLEAKIGRRDTPPARRTPLSSPPPAGRASEPLRPMPIAPTNERNVRQAKAGARSEPSPALPTAQVPWSEPESIENEIVRALRFDPQTRGGPTGNRQEPSSARPTVDPATTLGDLADKLEEALAREVQAAGQPRHPGSDVEDFGFENAAPAAENERAKPSTQKDRQEKRERSESVRNAKPAPAPEPEPRHEPSPTPERREEAPVISLSSRRRESADQLEDEMARLLGELTSDTKGR